jgi:hypothetical protein
MNENFAAAAVAAFLTHAKVTNFVLLLFCCVRRYKYYFCCDSFIKRPSLCSRITILLSYLDDDLFKTTFHPPRRTVVS